MQESEPYRQVAPSSWTARLQPASSREMWLAVGFFLALAALLRYEVRDIVTGDVFFWVQPWYDYLLKQGGSALGSELPNLHGFDDRLGNYPPPYYYLLYLATFFDGLMPRLYLIKAVSIAFDLVAAVIMFKIVRLRFPASRAWGAALAVLLAPTVLANSALWGQCDMIHSTLMLGSVYCSLKGKPAWTAILLGVALSFKAQPVFLFPYLLLLIWLNRMSWRHLLLVPLAFAAMMLPAALLGRPFLGLLTVYYDQSRFFSKLAMNVANLYYFVPNDFYRIGTIVGMLVTSVTSLLYAWLPRARRVVASTEFLLLAATMSAAMVPFLLPKMHDRYFLPADLLSIALVFYVPRLWYFAAGFQVTSGLAYIPIITDSFSGYDNEFTDLMPLAAILNTILIGALAVVYVRWVRGSGVPAGSRVTGGGEEVGAVGERS